MLDGVRVVELALWVAGPAVGGILADWGADVIKVESPAGDPMRGVFGSIGVGAGAVPPFELDNRGKRSVVLDLQTAAGREAMDRLLATADVLLTNLRPDALARLELDPESVRARFPRLVYASVTGYGSDGPDRDRPGYDIGAFGARSGLAWRMAPPGADPVPIRAAFGDHVTAITALAGLLGALLERERTGEGRLVEVSLLRTAMYCIGWEIGIQLRFGKLARTQPRSTTAEPLLNSYRAADDKWFWLLGLEGSRHWPGLLAATGRTDLAGDERFATEASRRANAAALVAELDAVFATRTRAEWAAVFDQHDVWWQPVQTIAEVVDDPQAIAAGAFVDMPVVDGETPYRAVASPVAFSPGGEPVRQPGPVPTLGQHTAEVLAELGL